MQPLPESPLLQQASPGSPEIVAVMVELAALKKELERASAENFMLRGALTMTKSDEDEEEGAAGAPAMPESFVMIPKKPPGFAQGEQEAEWATQSWHWTAGAESTKMDTPSRPMSKSI